MGDRKRSESGQYVETVSLDDVLGVFEEVRGPVITSSDVAEQLECTTEAARQKLTRLYDRGQVDKRKTGRTTVWWLVEKVNVPVTGGFQQQTQPTEVSTPEATVERSAETRDSPEDVETAIDRIDTPGTGETREKREQALRTAYEYLKENGKAQRKNFEELLGDDVGYATFNSWWTNYVKAKDALKQLPNVDPPGEGEHTWRFKHE